MSELSKGTFLIANPFLKDVNFLRTVVLMCDHNTDDGSFGFVVNRPFSMYLHELVPDVLQTDIPVSIGGPVQTDSLHFIHQYADLVSGGTEILPGIFWGGNFEAVKVLLNDDEFDTKKIRFFLGYSGWSAGQLDSELAGDSWITTPANRKLIFGTPIENVWRDTLRQMGGDYEQLVNYPLDPQLN